MTEHNPITMGNLSYEGEFLKSWEFKSFEYMGDYRIYFEPYLDDENEKGSGFKFVVIEWISNPSDSEIWDDDTEVEFLFNGIAYFDGVRHMYLGTSQNEIFGYVNYPNIEHLIEILKEIRKLEIEYCREYF